jgi:hypothetical protein
MVLMQSIRLCNNGLITSFAVELWAMGKCGAAPGSLAALARRNFGKGKCGRSSSPRFKPSQRCHPERSEGSAFVLFVTAGFGSRSYDSGMHDEPTARTSWRAEAARSISA